MRIKNALETLNNELEIYKDLKFEKMSVYKQDDKIMCDIFLKPQIRLKFNLNN